MKDCTTCKYGYKDERLDIPMCHHPKRFSEDCVDFNMHEEKEIETEQSGSSEIPNDLEEAAEISFDEAYALTEDYRNFLAKGLTENRPRPIGPHWFCEYAKNRFIAGAKWQKDKDTRDMCMSDNRHFQKVYELGRTDMREQMLKEAVEGEVCIPNVWVEHKEGKELVVRAEISKELGFKFGDKVRIIVLPKED